MSSNFNPENWYWRVGEDMRLWSSRTLSFVEADDAAYLAWAAEREAAVRAMGFEGDIAPHLLASPASSVGEIEARLREAGLPASLTDYVAARRYAAEIGGVTYEGHRFATDRETQAKYAGAAMMAQLNPAATFEWKALDGFVTLDAAGIFAVATAAGAHVQDCFALEASLTAAIAEGTVTTAEEIDAADWPGETA